MSTFQLSRSSCIKRFTFLPQHACPNERTHAHLQHCVNVCASVCNKHSLHCRDRRYLYLGRDGHVCVLRWSSAVRPCAAGATWTARTTSAPWAARLGHTGVIDAAGAIYVIGGFGGAFYYKDVWVSTDGGADRTRGRWVGGGGGAL